MEEKIELNIFLNKLVSAVTKKFEKLESDMEILKTDLEKFKQTGQKDNLKDFEEKLRNMEFSINSLKNKSQIDKSILKLIETEEQERKSEQYGR
jgi:TolA-binding protein